MPDQLDPFPGNLKRHDVQPGYKSAELFTLRLGLKVYDHLELFRQESRLRQENEQLRAERLSPEVFSALATWLRHSPRKPASAAFTHGMERQIAYALELDVLPEVKRLHQREQALMEAVARLMKAGNMLHDHVAHRHKESCEAWRWEVKHAEEHGHVTSY